MAKPHRVAFELEGEWLAAVLTWLERRHPHDTAARAAHWARIDSRTSGKSLRPPRPGSG
jgi:hypothetical protein